MSESEDSSLTVHLTRSVLPRIFDHIDTAALIADNHRRIIACNAAALSLFGYQEKDILGRLSRDLYVNTETWERLWSNPRFAAEAPEQSDRSLRVNSSDAYVARYRRRDGSEFKGETNGGPIRDTQGRLIAVVGFVKDITTRLSAEETLNALHSITSSRALDFDQRVDAILELGAKHFGLPVGILSHIENFIYRVKRAHTPDNSIDPGTEFPYYETFCSEVMDSMRPLALHHIAASEMNGHPCYSAFGIEAYLAAPILVDGQPYGTLNFSGPTPTRPFIRQDFELLKLFAEWVGHELARHRDLRELEDARRQLELMARTDPLTGLFNRRHMEDQLLREVAHARRYGQPLSVALLDMDHFKKINDTYGHAVGDDALRLLAREAQRISRLSDIFARWGGEEFLVCLPATGSEGAQILISRIMDGVKARGLTVGDQQVSLTVSVGITSLREGDDPMALVNRADAAMYQAKQNGRDRIVIDQPD